MRVPTLLAAVLLTAASAPAATFYVSPAGDDAAPGTSPAAAWRTAAKVNGGRLAPGDEVRFARGGTWREQLVAPASGMAGHSITFDAYGDGPKPLFSGSDPIPPAAFEPVDGAAGVYRAPAPVPVTSVLADHAFLRGTAFALGSNGNPNTADQAANLAKLKATPGTWFMAQDGHVYVNTGGPDPRDGHVAYTAVVRDDAVTSNGKDHLVFRDLAAAETASWDEGYGMRVMGSDDVRLDHCDVTNGGKHHFGCINSTRFIGIGLTATGGMDELGYGQATAYVTYSDASRHGDTSRWVDCTVDHYPGQLGAFYAHGEGVGHIDLRHMVSRGNWIALGTDNPAETVAIDDCVIENGRLDLYGNHITVDGLRLTGGTDGSLNVNGSGDTVRNCVVAGAGQSTIHVTGTGANLLSNTIVLRGDDPAIHLDAKAAGTALRGNVIVGTHRPVRVDGPGPFTADHDVYPAASVFTVDGRDLSFADWQRAGHDAAGAAVSDAGLTDPAAGDYSLRPDSPARRVIGAPSR